MDVKLFEIRDRATFIPAMAVRLTARDEAEFYLLRRAGYNAGQIQLLYHCCDCIASGNLEKPKQHGADPHAKNCAVYILSGEPYVVLWRLEDGPAEYDPYAWYNRTMANAHKFVIDHWHTLQSGQVIDVQFILGETDAPKLSERVTVRM